MLKYTVVLLGGMFAFMVFAPEPEGRIFGDKLVVSNAELVSAPIVTRKPAPVELVQAVVEPIVEPITPVIVPSTPIVAEVEAPRAYVVPAAEVIQIGATEAPTVPLTQEDLLPNVVLASVTIASKPVPRPIRNTIAVATPVAIEPNFPIWFVTGNRVNVRQGPSTGFTVMGSVVYGEAAEVIADSGGEWVKIRIEGDGVEGFIARRFMSEIEPAQ